MVPHVVSHIVLSLSLVEEQRTAFPGKMLLAHVSSVLLLPFADHYNIISAVKLKIIAGNMF